MTPVVEHRSVRLGRPVVCHGATVVAVEACSIDGEGLAGAAWFRGRVRPVAVIVSDSSGTNAFDMGGRPLKPAEVVALVPEAAPWFQGQGPN